MRKSWTQTFRRLAAGCVMFGATTFSSAMCYAINAFDSAADPVYADGWQAGDNGGFGFTPWNFDSGYIFNGTNYVYAQAGFKAIDDGLQGGTHFSNPFNAIGRSWVLGTAPGDDGAPHVGRGFAPLQIGQTLEVTIDNPTVRQFFKGYFVRLNGGTGGVNGNIANLGYASSFPLGTPVPKMAFTTFEYFTNGQWSVNDAANTSTGVFDTDTAAAGALFSVTRTGANTYDVKMDSLGGGADFMDVGRTFQNAGAAVDWIEFVFFNPVTDTGTPPTTATDFYISSIRIVPEPGSGMLLVLGAAGVLFGAAGVRFRRQRE